MKPDPLHEIWEEYVATKDCFRIAQEVVKYKEEKFLVNTNFASDTLGQAEATIRRNRDRVEEFFILALWVVFERHIINYIQIKGEKLKEISPSDCADSLYGKYRVEVERWRFTETLDILSKMIDPNLIGQAKQVKAYRDWIAHRNPLKPQPASTDPKSAYNALSKIIQLIDNKEA